MLAAWLRGVNGHAQGASDQEALAKAAQNPIAAMISVPFQNNFNFGIGPNNVTQWNLNVQPVIPISLSEDWNLITRTIIPIINQPSPAPGVRSAFGLGDINPQFYFSPAKPGELIWGVGPTFTFPTATDSMLGSGKWSAGPAVVALTIQGHWVIGAVANQQWSFAGWGDKNVSAFLVQPFVNYNLPHGWYLVASPIMTADWEADSARPVDRAAGRRRWENLQDRQTGLQRAASGLRQRGDPQQRRRLATPLSNSTPVPAESRSAGGVFFHQISSYDHKTNPPRETQIIQLQIAPPRGRFDPSVAGRAVCDRKKSA